MMTDKNFKNASYNSNTNLSNISMTDRDDLDFRSMHYTNDANTFFRVSKVYNYIRLVTRWKHKLNCVQVSDNAKNSRTLRLVSREMHFKIKEWSF